MLYLSPTAGHQLPVTTPCLTNNRYVGRYRKDGLPREAGKINVNTSGAGDAETETVNNFYGHSWGWQTDNLQILVFPQHQLLLGPGPPGKSKDRGIAFKVLSLNIWNEGMGNLWTGHFTDSEERIALAILDAKIENGLVGLAEVGGTIFLTHDPGGISKKRGALL